MTAESGPGPAETNTRRDFMQKMGTLAAAQGLAAGAAGAAGQAGMPMIRLGRHRVSRLIMGVNTIGGTSHLSRMIDLELKAWHTPERMVAIWKHCEELGINCMVQAGNRIARYNAEHGGKMLFCASGTLQVAKDGSIADPSKAIQAMAQIGPVGIHHAGYGEGGTDSMWRRGELNRVREWCKMVRDTGVLVAVTSHRPEVFMEIESQGWDVDYYMTCLYKYGRTQAEWEREFASNPGMMPAEIYHTKEGNSPHYGGETAFVRGDPPAMYKVIRQTTKPCFVYKLLASGRLCEKPEFVETAFRECFAQIKPTDAVVVGMWDKYEDQYAINAALVRRYGGNSGTASDAA